MKIEVHDVDHGQCVVITTPNQKRVVLDCGVNHGRRWYPSEVFRGQRIDLLVLQNLDEDHAEDLPGLWASTQIGSMVTNASIDAATLRAIKWRGMKPGVQRAHDILTQWGPGAIGWIPGDLGGAIVRWFSTPYGAPHTDTNNLSVAVIVELAGFSMLFGGDLETAGWRSLLKDAAFVAALARVRVMVASHHGRDNGKCAELFEHFTPELVIISDGAKQYTTQETDSWYRTRTSGVPEIDQPKGLLGYPRRYVMTTRRDGCITLDVNAYGGFNVTGELPVSAPDLSELLKGLIPAGPLSLAGGPNLSALAQVLGTRSPSGLADAIWPPLPEPYRPMTSGLGAARFVDQPPTGLGRFGLSQPAANALEPEPSVLDPHGLIANALLGTRKKTGFGF